MHGRKNIEITFLLLFKIVENFKGLKYVVNTITTVTYGLRNSHFISIPDKSTLMRSRKLASFIPVSIYKTNCPVWIQATHLRQRSLQNARQPLICISWREAVAPRNISLD